MEQRERLESIGQAIIASMDDLRHTSCPVCHHANLVPIFAEQHLIIKCHAPKAISGDNESEIDITLCSFSQVIYLTPISGGPFTMKFAEKEPKRPIKIKKAPRRRRRVE